MGHVATAGYEAVFITEHEAVWPPREMEELREKFPQLQIFHGVEKRLDACDVLVLGAHDPRYVQMRDTGQLLAAARDDGYLTVLAHPFRWKGGAEMLWEGLLPDAIEYRTGNHDEQCSRESPGAAEELHLALLNAGDVHSLDMIDCFWIETDRDFGQAPEIREIVLSGEYRNCQRDM